MRLSLSLSLTGARGAAQEVGEAPSIPTFTILAGSPDLTDDAVARELIWSASGRFSPDVTSAVTFEAIAGGGSGGRQGGGGGGAGRRLPPTQITLVAGQVYAVETGAGGPTPTEGGTSFPGSPTRLIRDPDGAAEVIVDLPGGGRGGTFSSSHGPGPGGSGGGAGNTGVVIPGGLAQPNEAAGEGHNGGSSTDAGTVGSSGGGSPVERGVSRTLDNSGVGVPGGIGAIAQWPSAAPSWRYGAGGNGGSDDLPIDETRGLRRPGAGGRGGRNNSESEGGEDGLLAMWVLK